MHIVRRRKSHIADSGSSWSSKSYGHGISSSNSGFHSSRGTCLIRSLKDFVRLERLIRALRQQGMPGSRTKPSSIKETLLLKEALKLRHHKDKLRKLRKFSDDSLYIL